MNRMPRFLLPAVVFGAALVAFPFFFLKLALFALIVGGAFRFFRRRMWGYHSQDGSNRWGGPSHWQSRRNDFFDRIRSMSDDEYTAFKQPRSASQSAQTEPVSRYREDFTL